MDNLNEIGLIELNENSLEEINGGIIIGIGLDLALDLENPLGLIDLLSSILGGALGGEDGGILG